ncbi:MAG TPA: hypothetical protein VFL85_02935 [Candidatus Saccharimonadales bacterium]|nr:hypothetical protein [Candidatus Saccharimonadales bacterium]
MPHKQHHETRPASVESASERIAAIYQSLHLLKFSTKPPVFTPEQAATPGLVFHALPGNTSLHIGPANAQNTPPVLRHWRQGAQADFVLWFNRHQRNNIISTPYYLGQTTGDITEQIILTPKDPKRLRAITPDDGSRWQNFMHIVEQAEALDIPKPDQSSVELSA